MDRLAQSHTEGGRSREEVQVRLISLCLRHQNTRLPPSSPALELELGAAPHKRREQGQQMFLFPMVLPVILFFFEISVVRLVTSFEWSSFADAFSQWGDLLSAG